MNDQDLRDCFAMMRGITGATPEECYAFADAMMEARKPKEKEDEEDTGIASVAKRTYKRKS